MSFLLQFVQYCIKNGSKLTLLWRTLRRCGIRKLSSICDIFYLRNMNVQDNNIMHVEYHNTIYNNHLQARSIYCTWPICFSLTLRNISHILFLFPPPPSPTVAAWQSNFLNLIKSHIWDWISHAIKLKVSRASILSPQCPFTSSHLCFSLHLAAKSYQWITLTLKLSPLHTLTFIKT